MQIGGGINPDNAAEWLDAGASHVIVTSYIFQDGRLDEDRLQKMVRQALLLCSKLGEKSCGSSHVWSA